MAKVQKKKKDKSSDQSGSFDFFFKMFSFLSGSHDKEREKARLVKEIGKQLKKQKFKFYNPKGSEALPGLARFFYDIYKHIAAIQLLIERAESSNLLKTIIIESFLPEGQRENQEMFDEAVIREKAGEKGTKELAAEYKEALISYYAAFTDEIAKKINSAYDLMDTFLRLIGFDYYFMIKKFDARLRENDFKYRPHFEAINGEYIVDDLKDFLEIMPLLSDKDDWQALFSILNVYKGTEVMAPQTWRSIIRMVGDVHRSSVFTLMVRHLDGDPYYKAKFFPQNHNIVEEYLSKIKTQTEITIQKILNEQRSNRIEKLTQQVFGTVAVSRMRHYTEKANLSFAKKMLGGYIYVPPINYLKAFLLDYLKSDVKEFVDILLIRGQWSTALLSQQLSESFHQLLAISDAILAFDDSLSEDGERGRLVKSATHKSDRDKSMVKVLRQHLKDINNYAFGIIKDAAQNLISVAKHLKSVLDDHKVKPPEIILNWKEIETAYPADIDVAISTIYKKIYYLTQLLQHFVKNKG